MSININSEASCRRAYINYHCYNNSMGISEKEMAEIVQTWGNRVNSWQNTVSDDVNEYEFDDSDFESYNLGRQEIKNASGDANKGSMRARGTGDLIAGAGGAAWGLATGGAQALFREGSSVVSNKLGANLFNPGSTSNIKTTTTRSLKMNTGETTLKNYKTGELQYNQSLDVETTQSTSKAADTFVYIQAALAIATALAYRIDKPNVDEKEACDEFQNLLANAQDALAESQDEMELAKDELENLSDEAAEVNEEGNEEIEENKTTQDLFLTSLKGLQNKMSSGASLTDSEKSFYKNLVKYINITGNGIQEASEDMHDEVGNIYGEMGEYQKVYDYAAETSAEVLGMTDEAENIDKATKTMCIVEAVSQGMNAASGAMAGAQLMGLGWWNWALGIASIAAGVSSGIAVVEQANMAKEVQNEIDIREGTQGFNDETVKMYDEEIDVYEGLMTGVEELEMELPEEYKVPDVSGNLVDNQSKNPNKKPEEKEENNE